MTIALAASFSRHQQQDVLKLLLSPVAEHDALIGETPAFPVGAGQAVVEGEVFVEVDVLTLYRDGHAPVAGVIPLHP